MSLQESGEMYLETILVLSQRTGFVRAIDIGEEMGYSKPSVSRAVGILRQGGYIHVAEDGACKMEHVISDASMEAIKRHAMGHIQ